MKKKIIGIILTLTMVLTLLPAFALPVKADGDAERETAELVATKSNCPFAVYKVDGKNQIPATPWDDEQDTGDYEWGDENSTLYIYSSDLIVTMASGVTEPANATINIPYKEGGGRTPVEKITFKNLNIVYKVNVEEKKSSFRTIVDVRSPEMEINLVGNNQIVDINKRPITNWYSDDNGVITGYNLTFTGDGNLNIECSGVAINAMEIMPDEYIEGRGEPTDITFNGTGEVKVKQCLYEELDDFAKEEVALSFEGQPYVLYKGRHSGRQNGAVAATGNINVNNGSLNVISKKANQETSINMGNHAVVANKKLVINTPYDVSIKSESGVAAVGIEEVIIGKNAKNITLVGYYEEKSMEVGALVSLKEPSIPKTFTVVGSKDQEFVIDSTQLKTASFEKVNVKDEEPKKVVLAEGALGKTYSGEEDPEEIDSVYTCFAGDEVAKTLVIKAPDKNPETKDTSAMLIWAFAGLAALAVAAGILVSRKQRD